MSQLKLSVSPTLENFRAYLAEGGDLEDSSLWVPLLYSKERSEIAHLLLDAGAKVSDMHEPLAFFCQGFDESVIRRVFEMIEDKPRALNVAMFQIAGTHRVEEARLLISLGAEINIMDPETKVTPLMSAASWRQGEMVELLLKAGAYRACVDSEGRNAAAYAKLAIFASKTPGANGSEENVAWILKLLESESSAIIV